MNEPILMSICLEQMPPEVYVEKVLDFTPPLALSTFAFDETNLTDFSSTGVAAHDQFTSSLDSNPAVLSFNNFTINAGHTVTTTQRCKGLYLNILGDLVINGKLSMTARGAKVAGQNVIIDKVHKKIYYTDALDSGFDYSPFTVIKKQGGLGTTGKPYITSVAVGGIGVNGACGAGGGNYLYRGGHATSFSGGAGAGGGASNSDAAGMSNTSAFNGCTAGTDNGGAGGHGAAINNSQGGGGAGNPGGIAGGSRAGVGGTGTGGLLILFVRGNIIFGASGAIQSNGSNGGNGHSTVGGSYPYSQGGAGSGGGAIHLFHRGTINSPSKITATGGLGGVAGNGIAGAAGGAGTVNIALF
jgi:hypothetical protein